LNLLSDIITYVRRLIKSPSNAQITDNLIIDYINRFWLMDVDARVQLFDLKTKYQFQTTPGISDYNMPLYNVQTEPGGQEIASFPVYQGFMQSCYVNGIQVPFYTQRDSFWNLWPNYLQSLNPTSVGTGQAANIPYQLTLPFFPAIPGHIDITGIIASGNNQDPPLNNTLLVNSNPPYNGNSIIPTTSVYSAVYFTATAANGQNIVVADSGQFLSNNTDGDLYGLLMTPGNAPYGNAPLQGGYSTILNTINYNTGVANVTFPEIIPEGNPIQAQCYFYQQGLPRAILNYNNCLTIRPPPDIPYLVELNAYLTPAAFLNTSSAIPFGYMAEYIARGAARKILADTGDTEQFMFYEPLFKEQETLVWKRSQRQFTATRTGTIFSDLQGQSNYNSIGQGST
jgi:hypothetical protein